MYRCIVQTVRVSTSCGMSSSVMAPSAIGVTTRTVRGTFFSSNWLRVLDTTERSQVDQRIGHQLHAIVPLLNTFKSEQQPLEFIFPRKGPLDTHPQGMDGGVEEPLAPGLGRLRLRGFSLMLGIIPALTMHLRCALESKPPSRLT